MKSIGLSYCFVFISSFFDNFFFFTLCNILCSLGDSGLFHGYKNVLLTPKFTSLIVKFIFNYLFQHYLCVRLFELVYTKLYL